MARLNDATDICICIAGVTHHADSAWLNGVKVWERAAKETVYITFHYTEDAEAGTAAYWFEASGAVASDITAAASATYRNTRTGQLVMTTLSGFLFDGDASSNAMTLMNVSGFSGRMDSLNIYEDDSYIYAVSN